MKNIFKITLVFALFLLLNTLASPGLFAQSDDIKALLGTWDIELTEMGMMMEFIFKFEDDSLTGELEFEMGGGTMEEIALEGNTLTFRVTIDAGGQAVNVETEATIEGDEMTGVMYTDMGEVEFVGIKRRLSPSGSTAPVQRSI